MKKNLFSMMLMACVATTAFVSCSDKDEDVTTKESTQTAVAGKIFLADGQGNVTSQGDKLHLYTSLKYSIRSAGLDAVSDSGTWAAGVARIVLSSHWDEEYQVAVDTTYSFRVEPSGKNITLTCEEAGDYNLGVFKYIEP
ncbi:hypothetical protein AGMMS49982_08620 [Bacteroidia bacterium]|nr:hypothetical protein AGMMS49982_08620 [Bacteroidia bacterium]